MQRDDWIRSSIKIRWVRTWLCPWASAGGRKRGSSPLKPHQHLSPPLIPPISLCCSMRLPPQNKILATPMVWLHVLVFLPFASSSGKTCIHLTQMTLLTPLLWSKFTFTQLLALLVHCWGVENILFAWVERVQMHPPHSWAWKLRPHGGNFYAFMPKP